MYRVGITGGIASGKSTVCQLFEKRQVSVVDADIIARQLVTPHSPCYEKIVSTFGPKCLQADKQVDRQFLRNLIFSNSEAKQQLESILHPAIHLEMLNLSEHVTSDYCILAIPLLVESEQDYALDRVLVIDSEPKLQLARLVERDGISPNLAQTMLDSQATRSSRLAIADDVLTNDTTVNFLENQVAVLDEQYRKFAAIKRSGC